MNTYSLLGGLLIMASLGSWAVWERGDAARWQEKFISLQASYQTATQQAKDDAAATEAKDLASLRSQSSLSISQAEAGKREAQTQLQLYLQKGNAASKGKLDLSHE